MESCASLAYPSRTLLEVLREDLGLPGTKHGCEVGECGTCTVLLDGQPALSCLLLPAELEGHRSRLLKGSRKGGIRSFAGRVRGPRRRPVRLLHTRDSPGRKSLLRESILSDPHEIEEALGGNLCRCTGYLKIFEAIERAASEEHQHVR